MRRWEVLAVLAVAAVLGAIVAPNWIRARARMPYMACRSNLKNLGTALEMYSTDNHGHYPLTVAQLTPYYIKPLPTCPASSMTYSYVYDSYPAALVSCPRRWKHPAEMQGPCDQRVAKLQKRVDTYVREHGGKGPDSIHELPDIRCPDGGPLAYTASWDAYTVVCSGLHHTYMGVSAPNYPQYSSITGLIDRP